MGALDGRTALVAGGASGIGRATVELLAAEGAAVVIADIQAGLGSELAARVGGRFIQTDVTDFGSWQTLVSAIERLDIVSLNPGVTTGERDLSRLTVQQYGRVMAVNVDGVTLVIHGRADTLITPSGGERTAELIPGANLLLLHDMGHDLPEPLWPLIVDAISSYTTHRIG